jgi:hypothetical protein
MVRYCRWVSKHGSYLVDWKLPYDPKEKLRYLSGLIAQNRYAYTKAPYAPYPFTAKPQLTWLEADLKAANANRAAVPCEYDI